MSHAGSKSSEDNALREAAERLEMVLGKPAGAWLVVDVAGQGMILVEDGKVVRRYGVSTAAGGISGLEGSFGTPPGVHRIERKIGAGMEPGIRFESREPVGKIRRSGSPGTESHDLILSRILTLAGCEEGTNKGPGCDSRERFIYIHGTNHEADIGRPVSHGCVRMSNSDVVDLFDRVEEGAPVVIV